MKINLCRMCGQAFKPRQGKIYCSDRCRLQAFRVTAAPCYYCGYPADGIDHVPPRSVRGFLKDRQVTRWPFVEVEACKECNSALGRQTIWTLEERKAYMKQWIRRRYARLLRLPIWSEEEISELGYNLAQMISESQVLAELTRKRLEW